MVEIAVEPSYKEIVCESQNPRGADGIVCSDVSHNGNLRSDSNIGTEEFAEERSERSVLPRP